MLRRDQKSSLHQDQKSSLRGADRLTIKYKLQHHAHRCQILESATSFIGAYYAFLHHWGDRHHRTSPTYMIKFRA